MKKILLSIFMLASILLVSCSDDGYVNIVSLNSFGSKFCRNDKVKVFVSAEMNDYDNATYTWGCDGGSLINPPGLFENLWQAPNEPGTYEVWCTVECDGAEQTRRMKMVVTEEYFYTDFETPYYNEGYSNSNMTVSYKSGKGTVGSAYLKAGSSNSGDVYYPRFARAFDVSVALPFSYQIDYALAADMPSRSGDKSMNTHPEYVETRFDFERVNNAKDYVSNVSFRIYPKTGVWEVVYNIEHLVTADTERVVALTGTDSQFKLSKDKFKTVSISMDGNKNFIVYFEGMKFCETNALASAQGEYLINRVGLYMDEKIEMYTDNWYMFDNGTICTASTRQR